MGLGLWGLWDAAASLPALRNGSGISVPDNLSLRHVLREISPSSALPLASHLFMKLAKKLLRMGQGGAEGGSQGAEAGMQSQHHLQDQLLTLAPGFGK